MVRLLAAFLAVMVPPGARARVVVPVTSCGQVIDRGQTGTLTGDLTCGDLWGSCRACASIWCPTIEPVTPCSGPADCPDPIVNECGGGGGGTPSVGVFVVPGGRLELNGHTISGAQIGIYGGRPDFTSSKGTITVSGPGTITATREAVRFYAARITDVTLRDNVWGITGSKVRLTDVDTSRNTIGASAFLSLRATGLVSDGNRYAGVLSYAGAKLIASHMTGNAVIDITTERAPRLVDTVCGLSAVLEETGEPGIYDPTGPPWGVCTGD